MKENETPKILCLPNGPYYLLNSQERKAVDNLQNSKGEKYSTIMGIALCRCGGSKNKPFCDGTHGIIGFRSNKESDEDRNKRKNYIGKKITIHDNRGICSHAGYCVRNLSKIFRLNERPWIDPDAAGVDEIIAAVKKCPSGALSYSTDGLEHNDQDRNPMVTVSRNGPYYVTGGIELIGETFGEGASKEHYALCRCGASKNKPFCDGMHLEINFRDE